MRPLRLLLVPLLLLAACGEQAGDQAADSDPATALSGPADPVLPDPDQVLTTAPVAVTVLDDGSGPQLCLGGVAESYPPQCGGPPLLGWDWEAQNGVFEEASGVRWGEFVVSGTYDGTSFTVADAIPLALYDPVALPEPDLPGTPCPEPDGGWQVIDPELTTDQTMDQTFAVAAQLDGYAGAWMDQSVNPFSADPGLAPEVVEQQMNDPTRLIINVRVTGDVAAAERELRTVWGGALCVSRAELTETELQQISDELVEARVDLLSGGVDVTSGTVEIHVVFDDGTLQARLDEQYGAGLVRVTSALTPQRG